MPKYLLALVSLFFLAPSNAARAEVDCTPHCNYNHFYGPYNYTYVRPGLFGYPRCAPNGYCSPHLVYRYSFTPEPPLRIIVRPRARVRR
jgi:hypothetical protein